MIVWNMSLMYQLKLYKSSSKPIIEMITAKNPIYKKLSSACPSSLVDIKNAIEHAIPPNGGTYLEESLFSFFLFFGRKYFVLWSITQFKSIDNKIDAIAAFVRETWKLVKFTFVALDLFS